MSTAARIDKAHDSLYILHDFSLADEEAVASYLRPDSLQRMVGTDFELLLCN